MYKRIYPLLTLFTLFPQIIFSQNKFDTYDFYTVDSLAKSIKYNKDVIQLAKDLTVPYKQDIYKARSIFRWVTENIEYDYKLLNSGKELKKPNCESVVDCSQIISEWEWNYIKDVLKNKKGVCNGYAKVFKKLCDLSGIKCEIVNGYIKSKPYQIGNSLSVNHAWNAVMLDSVWYYLDPTWAAGGVVEDEESGKLLQFVKEYKNYYWLTPYTKLVRNHYPKTDKWVQKPVMVKEIFFNMPHYYTTEILEKISNEKPVTGMLLQKKGDTIRFSFNYKATINKLQINTNNFRNPQLWYKDEKTGRKMKDTFAERKQVYIPFEKNCDNYKFDYVITENSLYYIELLFDYKKSIRYRVKISE
jgi:Transglutaminase-like superfamily